MKTTIIVMCLCLMLCASGCENRAENSYAPDKLSATKYSEVTGKYYQETADGYKAAFYEKTEISIEKIKNWLNSCPSAENYYQCIDSDPDSWDMFLYYAPADSELQYSGFDFTVDDSTVKIHITNDESLDSVKADYILIRVQAPLRGAWPNSSELYFDGEKIEMQK